MIKIDLTIDVSELKALSQQFSKGLTKAAFPNTANAFIQSRQMIAQAWRDYVMGETSLDGIQNIDKPNLKMAESIKENQVGDFSHIVYSDNKQMEKIAQGTPDVLYDMKLTHPYGRKSRVAKDGIPYLIIPFRWGTPNEKGTKRRWNNVIPQKVYETNVKALDKSITLARDSNNPRYEKNAQGQMIERMNYAWENRLKNAWDDKAEGMVRMKNASKSTYFTFRIISAASASNKWWYHRAGKPGIDIIGALYRTMKNPVDKTIESGIKADESMYSNS